jgi:hypothetical protein
VQNKFYILEREQGTLRQAQCIAGNREQIRNTEIFLFSKNVKLILLRYLYETHNLQKPNPPTPLPYLSITHIFLNIKFDKRKHLCSGIWRQKNQQ